MQRFDDWSERLAPAFARFVDDRRRRAGELALRLPTPQAQVENAALLLGNAAARIRPTLDARETAERQRINMTGQGLAGGRVRETLGRFWPLIAMLGVGIALGASFVKSADPDHLLLLMAFVVLTYCFLQFAGSDETRRL